MNEIHHCAEHSEIVGNMYEIKSLLTQISGSVQEIECDHKAVANALRKVEIKLFRDNGEKSHQTRLDRLEQCQKVTIWIGGTTAAAVIVQILDRWF